MAGGRVDEVADNVFAVSGRINSTWGGGLVDMVRARRILEIIETEGLIEAAVGKGEHFLAGCRPSPPRTAVRSPTPAAAACSWPSTCPTAASGTRSSLSCSSASR